MPPPRLKEAKVFASFFQKGPLTFFAAAALGAGNFLYPYLAARTAFSLWTLAWGLLLAACIWIAAKRPRRMSQRWIVVSCLAACLLVEVAAESWWPNSADEYGYVFLARTLLKARLWNPPPPAPEIFEIAWTFTKSGKWFSQYAPGWPALLAPFLALNIGWLLNPLLTAGLASLMLRAMRRLDVGRNTAAAVTCLCVFSPFVLFNGASLFPHTLTAVLVMAIVLLWRCDGSLCNVAVGSAFGALLLTRYEVFALSAAAFAVAGFWRERARFLRAVPLMSLGGLPFALCFAAYNHAITGHALRTPIAWASPGAHIGLLSKHVVPAHALAQAALRSANSLAALAAFTSLPLVLLAGVSLTAKLRARSLDWFDALLPMTMIFFFFYPSYAGHEFGPRYWFFAWPTAMLTIATAWLDVPAPGWLGAGRFTVHAGSLARAHLPAFLGMAVSTAVFTHIYVDARRDLAFPALPPHERAVVLIPTRELMLTRWQTAPLVAHSGDFCRNGVQASGDVLAARADAQGERQRMFAHAACSFTGRHVYRWQAPGRLAAVDCRGSEAAWPQAPEQRAGQTEDDRLPEHKP